MKDNCLYDVSVTVPREDSASAAIEIKINRQSKNTKAPLDDIGLYGLKLYGLSLEFMGEDEKKIGYVIVQVTKGNNEVIVVPDLKRLVPLEDGAFWLDFETTMRVQDGDTIALELII